MKQSIYKYPIILPTRDTPAHVELPLGAEVLTIQTQFGQPMLWALVRTEVQSTQKKELLITGTGHPLEDMYKWRYLSTVQLQGGDLVFHIFEKKS